MKEFDQQNGSKTKLKYIVIAIMLIVFFSVTTSYFTVKTVIPTPPTVISTPAYVMTTNTPKPLYVAQTEPPSALYTSSITPTQLQMPEIETNLLKNSGFENGLLGWTYSNNLAGLYVYEIAGVNGKGFCSRQYLPYINLDDTMASTLGHKRMVSLVKLE